MTLDKSIILNRAGLRIELAQPGTYYRGTRFDWSGVFRRIVFNGLPYCDEWFDIPDPFRHDNVCGPSEEFFGTIGYDDAKVGGTFLKAGVGLLRRDSEGPYDWFHRYEIEEAGERTVETSKDKATFTHSLPGIYEYRKTVEITGDDSFRISHSLISQEPLALKNYCHNFFTFGLSAVGPERSLEFDAPVSGVWREDSENARIQGNRIFVTAQMQNGQKCYLGGIEANMPDGYGFTLYAGKHSVRVQCSRPLETSVLWSNHRVFCPEAYVSIETEPQVPFGWTIDYKLI